MSNEFVWPWQYDFPPFFTLQCNADTKAKQLDTWCTLVLSYHRHFKIFRLRLVDVATSPLFYNKAINRKLPKEVIIEILETLKRKGNIEWEDKTKASCLIFWKTPQQWADIIYNWAAKTGQLNSVCTLHEMTQGINTTDEEFYGLEDWLLLRSLRILQSKGKAELIGNEGVKFF